MEKEKTIDTITIERNEGGTFNVIQGDKYADRVTYDEMLGLTSALTMPDTRPCLHWMRTKERHEALLSKFEGKPSKVEFERILVPENIEIYLIDFKEKYGDRLLIKFNNQLLGFFLDNWIVNRYIPFDIHISKVQCKLIPCNRDDLKVGDTAFADLFDDTKNIFSYCKVINEREIAYPRSDNGISVTEWNVCKMQWYKVVPVCS